jgi:hypothetical protein
MIGDITYLSEQSLQGRFDQRYQHGTTPRHTSAAEFTMRIVSGLSSDAL